MRRRLSYLLPTLLALVIAAAVIPSVASAGASSSSNGLAGKWVGKIDHAMANNVIKMVRLRLIVDAKQTGGSWYVSAACHGPLTNDGISNGYHHYGEVLATGSTCVGGAEDCLWRDTATSLYDNVTPPATVSYSAGATLTRVTSSPPAS